VEVDPRSFIRHAFPDNFPKETRSKNMTSETLRVVARIIALPDKVDEVRSLLDQLIEPTREESGCISYELLQNKSQPGDFTFVEEWESDEALDTHMGTAHVQDAISGTAGLLVEPPDIRRYRLLC
jgi:quinol monooxygenase YgiN